MKHYKNKHNNNNQNNTKIKHKNKQTKYSIMWKQFFDSVRHIKYSLRAPGSTFQQCLIIYPDILLREWHFSMTLQCCGQ